MDAIEVSGLYYRYGRQLALRGVDLVVPKGQIVGLLGVNGAGKSTLMKLLATYLRPQVGRVCMAGYEVAHGAVRARSVIGYLPEHNPLYEDMYVGEFLDFVARSYGLMGQKRKQSVAEVVEACALGDKQKARIQQLSKGYRQRLGLARVLVHKPKILLLDEPTAGLDPHQLDAFRVLLQALKTRTTIVLSTHILQEVQAVCNRIIILDNGTIAADHALANVHSNELQVTFDRITKKPSHTP